MNVNAYLARAYPFPPCWALVADVLARERGLPVQAYAARGASLRQIADAFRLHLHGAQHGFTRIDHPADLAVVLMGKSARLGLHHCGVAWRGEVLHALPGGVFKQDLASLRSQYPAMEFWQR